MNKKYFISLSIAAALTIGSLPTLATTASANSSVEDLKKQQGDVSSKKEEVNGKINEKKSQIDQNINKQKDIQSQIAEISTQLKDTETKITEKTKEIDETTAKINKLKADIEELEKKIEERNELLKERARAIQEKGGSANYLDVLLGANSFGDFINRVTAVNTIVSADKKIMDEQKRDQAELEKKQAEVEKELADLEASKANLESLKKDLDSQKAKKAELFKQLEAQQATLKVEKADLEKESEELSKMEHQLEGEIQAEQARLAELARKREQERKRQAEAEAAKRATAQEQATSGGSSSTPTVTTPVSSGTWTAPAHGTITTNFGWDTLNGKQRFHYGTDIAAHGSVPISAAADGYVIKSHYSSSYGNVVYITHSINGQTFTTVYAHMSSSLVSTGQAVNKGDQIGYMGNTGYSFGQHLHFELYRGSWSASHANAVDPRQYINF
ncbi:peptidoglycan DD-metalloendopeptidase family protein [Rossellomorea aquimaris]|uniref:murein hydrolase activator EnvC family protein n=1 Tax=Rossellomorea aquimaris TaxID=189382 RepID=UPI001CD58A2A|nr:M23 family metallopeptidase [Rossellomorea aquimaris]MCA1061356.1 peptidoglycan DD-metalloendopeptidase family protein [Rossellomorea aquimaris]